MSVEFACECDGLPAHSHIYAPVLRDHYIGNGGTVCAGPFISNEDTGEVRIWVDWKAVARELAHA